MKPPNPAFQKLARRVIAGDARAGGDPQAIARVAEQMFQRLHDRFTKLIGTDGFRTMLARALNLAQRTLPALASVRVTSRGEVAGLSEALVGRSTPEAQDVPETLLAYFIDLLAAFIGDDLAVRLVEDAVRNESADTSRAHEPARDGGEGGSGEQ